MWDRDSEGGRTEQLPGKSNSQGAVESPELRHIIYYMQPVYVFIEVKHTLNLLED